MSGPLAVYRMNLTVKYRQANRTYNDYNLKPTLISI